MKLTIVGGPYKSGTSLACKKLASQDNINPFHLTNAREYGHGICTKYYPTFECSIARELNTRLLGATRHQCDKIERFIAGILTRYFSFIYWQYPSKRSMHENYICSLVPRCTFNWNKAKYSCIDRKEYRRRQSILGKLKLLNMEEKEES